MLNEVIYHNRQAADALGQALQVTANGSQPELHGILCGAMNHIKNQECHLSLAQAMIDEQNAVEASKATPAMAPGLFSRIARTVFGK